MTLAARLSAFFLAALALVLAGFSVALYLLAWTYLSHQVDQRLTAALDTLAAAAEVESNGLEWEPDEHRLALGRGAGADDVRWAVHDGQGKVLDRSANLASAELAPGAPLALGQQSLRQVSENGQPWRIAERCLGAERRPPAVSGQGDQGRRYEELVLTAGLSLRPMQATLRTLAGTLAGLSLVVWLAAALLGRRVGRRALAPVSRMAGAARGMGAAELGQRLPLPGTGDELDDLGRSFNGLLDRLQEAFRRQQQFTGDASHQLRTPLAAMLGQVEVLLRRDRPPEEYRRVLALVRDQATGLTRIVEALLFLARADAEGQLAGLEVLDLARWLPEQLGRWGGHPRAADLRAEGVAAGPYPVRAQPVLLGQLLDNLLDNACRHSEPGMPVRVALAREPGGVVLAVADAGRGIAAEDLPHVFEPFYRSADARRRGDPGVGLGLAVVRRVAHAFGGSVRVDSTPGAGSTFTVELRCAGPV